MNRRISMAATCAPVIVCTGIAYLLLFFGNKEEISMDWGQTVAIGIAIIGVIGTLCATFMQLKRDGKTIDGISSTSSAIKEETALIKSEVAAKAEIIGKDTSKIESISANVSDIVKRNEKIDEIAKELEFQKRLKSECSGSINGKDTLVAGISAVYEENARLNQELRAAHEQNMKLELQKAQLEQVIGQKNQRISDLEKQVDELRPTQSHGMKPHL